MKKLFGQFPIKPLLVGMALLISACNQESRTTEKNANATLEKDTTMRKEGHAQHKMEDDQHNMQDDQHNMQSNQQHMQGDQKVGMTGQMHQHMRDMQGMRPKMTGDPDYDFAMMMTQHQQGGIRMSEQEVAKGNDAKLKDLANRIMKEEQEDINQLQGFTKAHKPVSGDTTATMRMMHPMNKMMSGVGKDKMGMNMDTTSVDRSFASMMISHHQMGNEMAHEYLKQGKAPQMKQMAQKMVNQQEKEIKELEAWQKEIKQ